MKFFKWWIHKETPIVLDPFVKAVKENEAIWEALHDLVWRLTQPEYSGDADMRNSIMKLQAALDAATVSFELEHKYADSSDG